MSPHYHLSTYLPKQYWHLIKTWFQFKNEKVLPRRVTFVTFDCNYQGNPRYICEKMIDRGYDIYWVISKTTVVESIPKRVKTVLNNSDDLFRILMSSKVIVFDAHIQQLGFFKKKPEQIFIQTWHGSTGLKRFGPEDDPDKRRVYAARRTGKQTDYFLANSDFEINRVMPVYWSKAIPVKIGHARNDVFFADSDKRAEIRSKLQASDDQRIAVYAPTYRDYDYSYFPSLDFEGIVRSLRTRFGGNWVFFVKTHHNTTVHVETGTCVRIISDHDDLYEILAVADAGITDYSSWIFDFMCTGKPCFIHIPDYSDYEKGGRRLYFKLSELPVPVSSSENDLEGNILDYDELDVKVRVQDFNRINGVVNEGAVSEKTASFIEQVMSDTDL